MNIEEKAAKAEKFLESLKVQVFTKNSFSNVYTDIGTLKGDIKGIITDFDTNLQNYKTAKEQARRHTDQFFQSNLTKATLDLDNVLLDYEELCVSKIFPTLKEKLIDLPSKIDNGNIKLDQTAPIETTVEKPPPKYKVIPEVTVPIDPLGDEKINAVKEKINRALEWIEIPLEIGEGVGEFLSEHGGTIVSAVSGVLKLLTI